MRLSIALVRLAAAALLDRDNADLSYGQMGSTLMGPLQK